MCRISRERERERENKRKKPQKKCYRCHVESGGDLSGTRKKRRRKTAGSVDADPGCLDNRKKEAEEAQGLNKNCRESMRVWSLCRV